MILPPLDPKTAQQAAPHPRFLKIPQSWFVYGFLYWVVFLMVLEPDNAVRAWRAGYPLTFVHEAVRIAGAALVGAAVTPVLLLMTDRMPITGPARGRNAFIHLAATAALAFGLIVVSCVLAAWAFERRWLPSVTSVRGDLVSNWAVLAFALAFFTAITHALRLAQAVPAAAIPTVLADRPERFTVKSRGRTSFIDTADIDWIETQGNYVAFHVGTRQHLIRDTLTHIETQLDARRFVRIHRRVIVAIPKIQDIRAETNGDATLRLIAGQELRVSRRFRKAVRERWGTRGCAL